MSETTQIATQKVTELIDRTWVAATERYTNWGQSTFNVFAPDVAAIQPPPAAAVPPQLQITDPTFNFSSAVQATPPGAAPDVTRSIANITMLELPDKPTFPDQIAFVDDILPVPVPNDRPTLAFPDVQNSAVAFVMPADTIDTSPFTANALSILKETDVTALAATAKISDLASISEVNANSVLVIPDAPVLPSAQSSLTVTNHLTVPDVRDAVVVQDVGNFDSHSMAIPSLVDYSDIPATINDPFDAYVSDITDKLVTLFGGYINEFFPIDNQTNSQLEAWLQRSLTTGGSGINSNIEAQLWERDRSRVAMDAMRATDEATNLWASRRFPLPPGALMSATQQIQQKAQDEISKSSREQAIKSFETEVANARFAVDNAIKLRSTALSTAVEYIKAIASGHIIASQLIGHRANVAVQAADLGIKDEEMRIHAADTLFRAENSHEQLKLTADSTRVQAEGLVVQSQNSVIQAADVLYRADAAIDNVNVALLNAQISSAGVEVQASNSRTQAADTLFRASNAVDNTRIASFTAQSNMITAQAQVGVAQASAQAAVIGALATHENTITQAADTLFKAENAHELAKIALDGARIQADNSNIQLQAVRVQAEEATIRGHAAIAGANASIAQANASVINSEIQAALSRVEAIKTYVTSQVALDQSQVELFKAEVGAYAAELGINAQQSQAEAALLQASAAFYNARNNAADVMLRAQLEQEKIYVDVSKADLTAQVAVSDINARSALAISQSLSQQVVALLNNLHVSAGISASGSQSFGGGINYSYSGRVDEFALPVELGVTVGTQLN